MTNPWSVPRSRATELMDDPGLDAGEHMVALDALGRINTLSGTSAQLAAAVRRLAGERHVEQPLRVVDVACGGGDVSVGLARRLGPMFHVHGIDMSDRAVGRARLAAARLGVGNVSFTVCDVLAAGCPPADVAVSSLFFHHLDDATAAALLRSLADAAALGFVVSDLVRSRRGLFLAHLVTRVLTNSRVARIDGPLSVRAARTIGEYKTLLDAAGLHAARLAAAWPERVLIEWHTAASGARP